MLLAHTCNIVRYTKSSNVRDLQVQCLDKGGVEKGGRCVAVVALSRKGFQGPC